MDGADVRTARPTRTGYYDSNDGRRIYHPAPGDITYSTHTIWCERCAAEALGVERVRGVVSATPEDIEHARHMAAFHQRRVIVHAWLFSITGVLAFVVSPWLFAQAALFALSAYDHREARNRELVRTRVAS